MVVIDDRATANENGHDISCATKTFGLICRYR
jgi:hypothetical protein